jgi:hypothetical protein
MTLNHLLIGFLAALVIASVTAPVGVSAGRVSAAGATAEDLGSPCRDMVAVGAADPARKNGLSRSSLETRL